MRHLAAVAIVAGLALAACSASDGADGTPGSPGPQGDRGPQGDPGGDGRSAWLTGPGVDVEVTDLDVSATGATVELTLRDGAGVALDARGLLTAGPVAVAFALGRVGSAPGAAYAPYTTRVDVAADGASASQGAVETGGALEALDVVAGRYRYTFATPLTGFEAGETQTVVVSAARTVDGVSFQDGAERSVRPDGGALAARGIVEDARCAACHGAVSGHGGRFAAVGQCLVCHARPAVDPDTGSALDLGVMVHRIHRGAGLPSVVQGTPYRIVGAGTVFDYSGVRFPRTVKHCAACHGGADGDAWETRAGEATCLSCHDDVALADPVPAGKVLHGGGALPPGQACTTCHRRGGPSPVAERHLDPSFDPAAPRLSLAIREVRDGFPGQQPTLVVEAKVDDVPRDLVAQPLTTLRATFAGPNGDYARSWQATLQGAGGLAPVAIDAAAGLFAFTLPPSAAVPLDATGSYTVGLEGNVLVGATRPAAHSPVRAFAVTDATAVPRRTVVDSARCDACHLDLAYHGGSRKNPQYCATCHGANQTNDERVARLEGSTVVAESLELGVLIHKIHAGDRLTQPYRVYGNPAPSTTNPGGTLLDFGGVRYPRSRGACEACHLPGTFALPAPRALPSLLAELACAEPAGNDTDSFCSTGFWSLTRTIPIPPETAVCTSCHDQPYVAVHAQVSTSPSGAEACATCHGPGSALDVAVVHGR